MGRRGSDIQRRLAKLESDLEEMRSRLADVETIVRETLETESSGDYSEWRELSEMDSDDL